MEIGSTSREQRQQPAPLANRLDVNDGRKSPRHEFTQYRRYIAHLEVAAGTNRQVGPPIPGVHPQPHNGSTQGAQLPRFTASPATITDMRTPHHHYPSFGGGCPQSVAARQPQDALHIGSNARYGIGPVPGNMTTPTLSLPDPRQIRGAPQTRYAPTPVMTTSSSTPHPRSLSAELAISPAADRRQRKAITEGLQRLETLEDTLKALKRRADVADRDPWSALANLDQRLSSLEHRVQEQQPSNPKDIGESPDMAKARCSECSHLEPPRQDTHQVQKAVGSKIGGVDSRRTSFHERPRHDIPMSCKPVEGGTGARGRYDLRRRTRRPERDHRS